MRIFFLLSILFLNLQVFAQEQVDEVESDIMDPPLKDQAINVECNCPTSEVQAEEAPPNLNSIFPSGSVFLVSPEATTPAAPVQKEEEYIPGYVDKLQRGYSDDSYKQIIRD